MRRLAFCIIILAALQVVIIPLDCIAQRIIHLADVNSSFIGPGETSHTGYFPIGIGDINKDSIDDFIIDSALNGQGHVYIFLGKPNNWSKNTSVDQADIIITGESGYTTCFGYNPSPTGDVDSDGIPDILVGDICYDERGRLGGKAYVLYGNNILSGSINSVVTDYDYTGYLPETYKGDYLGDSTSYIGDVNGDGIDDYALGADSKWTITRGYVGKVYVFFGSNSRLLGDYNVTTSNASFIGDILDGLVGQVIRFAGDVNNDGYDDFMFSSEFYNNYRGRTFLIFGKGGGWLNNEDVWKAGVTFYGETQEDRSGHRLGYAGDVNGDGISDFLIGAPFNEQGGIGSGKAYLYWGKSADWSSDYNLSEADVSFIGLTGNFGRRLGHSVTGLGDVNGDGYGDFTISASASTIGNTPGEVYLFLGKSSGWTQKMSPMQADIIYRGENPKDGAGLGLEYAGDINGDGFDDVLIGAPHNDSNGQSSGKVYLHFPFHNTRPSSIDVISLKADANYSTQLTNTLCIDNYLYLQIEGTDGDLNQVNVTEVQVTSTLDPYGIKVRCNETSLNSGIFRRAVRITDHGSNYFCRRIRSGYQDVITVTSLEDPTKSAITDVHAPTPTITPTMTPTIAFTPFPYPKILMAGYLDTALSISSSRTEIKMAAWVDHPLEIWNVGRLDLYYQGTPTGIYMTDLPDRHDAIWNYEFSVDATPAEQGLHILELAARDYDQGISDLWPYLTVH